MTDVVHYQSPYTNLDRFKRLLWQGAWAAVTTIFPRSLGNPVKVVLLRAFGAKVSSSAKVYSGAKVFLPKNLIMEDNACLGEGVICYNTTTVRVGSNATVSQRTYLCTASHDITDERHPQTDRPITIGNRAWVAAEAYIGPGVSIGEGAVVGARACVYKSVDPWTVVGGNPAVIIKMRVLRTQQKQGGGE